MGTIGQENYKNILRRQNEFAVKTKALPLYLVYKVKLGNILNAKQDGRNILQRLDNEGLITGVESILEDKEDKVFFMGPGID